MATTANVAAYRLKVRQLQKAARDFNWSLVAMLASELDGWDFEA